MSQNALGTDAPVTPTADATDRGEGTRQRLITAGAGGIWTRRL